ncbi:MAG: hypothetical protein QXO03_03450 [Thermoplasmatales archaeon]
MRNVDVVLDELQTISPSILTRIISEGRKFSLWSVMATQSLNSLPVRLADSIRTNAHNFFMFQMSHEDKVSLHVNDEWMQSPDFHSFVCYVPSDSAAFTETLKPLTPSRDLRLFEDFYCFDDDSQSEVKIEADRMESAYISQLVSNGLAFIVDGKVMMNEDYFKKIGLRGRKGTNLFSIDI